MKTSIKLCASFILALSAVACTTETIAPETDQEMVTITLSTDGPITVGEAPETKTGLSSDGSVVWKTGDDIALFLWPDTQAYKLDIVEESINGSSAKFSGQVPAASLEAVQKYLCAYPYSESVTATSATEIANVTLPSKTKLASGSFFSGTNVSVATYADSKLTFKNVLGLLHIKVTGDFKFKKMKVTAEEVNTPANGPKLGSTQTLVEQTVTDVPMTGKGNVDMETYTITPATDAVSYVEFEQGTNQTLSETAKNYYPAVFPTNITEGNALTYTLSIVEDATQDIYTQRIRLDDNTNLEQGKALLLTANTAYFTKQTTDGILASWITSGNKGYEKYVPSYYTKAGLSVPEIKRGAGMLAAVASDAINCNPHESGTTYDTAVAANSYIEFTFIPDEGKSLSFSKKIIEVYLIRNASGPASMALAYSVDGGDTFVKATNDIQTTKSSSAKKHTITLTDEAYDALQNITGTVIFRIYAWNTGSSNSTYMRIKAGTVTDPNMIVKGTIQ